MRPLMLIWLLCLPLVSGCVQERSQGVGPAEALRHPGSSSPTPLVDHHQHLLSPDGAALVNRLFDISEKPLDGARLVELLDEAGIERAIVLSDAYYFDAPETEHLPGSRAAVRRENDWTAAEAARFPKRLLAFCSVNPLKDYAVAVVERCAASAAFHGLKLHFDTSGVDLLNPEHVARVKKVFQAANAAGLPIHVHAARQSDPPYGEAHARVFLEELLTSAPDIPVIMGHLWGGGDYSPGALRVYAGAVSAGSPATKNLYFEVAQATSGTRSQEQLDDMAERMRQIGLERIFYGSDGAVMGGIPPKEAWLEFRQLMPLSQKEFEQIAQNVAPFLRAK